MKKYCLLALSITAAFLLAGCSHKPVYQTKNVLEQPTSQAGKRCLTRCEKRSSSCHRRCGSDQEQCFANETFRAEKRYQAYVKGRQAEGKKLELTFNDFIDRSRCNKTCGCTKNYNQCALLCGGAYVKKSKCVKNCS